MRCGADDRQALEQLCRYITRPALANERVQTNAAGQVVLKLKTALRDGTTHLVMSPPEFIQARINDRFYEDSFVKPLLVLASMERTSWTPHEGM